MQTSVTFKNLDPSENLRSYVADKLDRFDRLLNNPAEAKVVLSVEKFRHIADVNLIGDKLNINGKEETNDMYSAIDMVLDKLEKQIKRSKQKIRGRRKNSQARAKRTIADETVSFEDEAEGQIKIKNIEYKPMDIEEAVLQLDLVSYNFLVFTNSRTEKINVLYHRKDGHLGLIQPSN